jgi:hypothetical protein
MLLGLLEMLNLPEQSSSSVIRIIQAFHISYGHFQVCVNNIEHFPDIDDRHVKKLMDKFGWDFAMFSQNPNVPSEFLERHMDNAWDFEMLSKNKNLTRRFIERHISEPWNWMDLSVVAPWDFISTHAHRLNYKFLSLNTNITPEFIENNLHRDWHWGPLGLSANRAVSMEFIEKHIDRNWHWGIYGLSINTSINEAFLDKYAAKPWYYGRGGLSNNTSIPFTRVQRTRDRDWDIRVVLRRLTGYELGVFLETRMEAMRYYQIPFPSYFEQCVSGNPNVTPELVEGHDRFPWDYMCLSRLESMGKYIERHHDLPWDWRHVSFNKGVSLKFLEEHEDRLADWKRIYVIENKAAKTIQLACEDWLWKPVCRDGTPGIHVRLMLQQSKS